MQKIYLSPDANFRSLLFSVVPGQEIDLPAHSESERCSLHMAIDYVYDYPNSRELQGFTTYQGHRYRATIVVNHHHTNMDSITLVPHS